jgi:hypothetical protein
LQSENWQPRNVEGRRGVGSRIGDADIQRRLDRMISDVGRVMAGATKSGNAGDLENVVEAPNSGDVDFCRVEDLLTARNRLAKQPVVVATGRWRRRWKPAYS